MKGTEVLNPRRGVPQWGYDANTRFIKHNNVWSGLVSPFGLFVARGGRKRGNRQTDRQTRRTTTVTLAAHARRRGLTTDDDDDRAGHVITL